MPSLDLDSFQKIVLAIHRAALDPSEWQTVLDRLAYVSGGVHTHLFGHDMATEAGIRLDGALYDPSFMRSYDRYYNRLNAWAPGYLKADVGVPMLTRQLMPNDEFEKTEFYNDWIRPQGDILGGCGIMIMREGNRIVALGGNIRRKDIDRVEADFAYLLERLAPHLRLALDFAQRVGELHLEREVMLSGLASEASLFVVSDDAALVYANTSGQQALEAGLIIRLDRGSRLNLVHPMADEAFRSALRNPAYRRGRAINIAMQSAKLELRLVPVDPSSIPTLAHPFFGCGKPPAAVLAISTRRNSSDPVTRGLSGFGLSGAEVAVARELVQGLTLSEIAQKRGVSIHTVRNQIQSVLDKSGTSRQTELVALVLRLSPEVERNTGQAE